MGLRKFRGLTVNWIPSCFALCTNLKSKGDLFSFQNKRVREGLLICAGLKICWHAEHHRLSICSSEQPVSYSGHRDEVHFFTGSNTGVLTTPSPLRWALGGLRGMEHGEKEPLACGLTLLSYLYPSSFKGQQWALRPKTTGEIRKERPHPPWLGLVLGPERTRSAKGLRLNPLLVSGLGFRPRTVCCTCLSVSISQGSCWCVDGLYLVQTSLWGEC